MQTTDRQGAVREELIRGSGLKLVVTNSFVKEILIVREELIRGSGLKLCNGVSVSLSSSCQRGTNPRKRFETNERKSDHDEKMLSERN